MFKRNYFRWRNTPVPVSTSLGSPWELSAGGIPLAAGETHLLQVTLLENTWNYTQHKTQIMLDTTSFWRLAEYRKWFFSLLPQTANHKDTTNFKREEQTFSSLDLFQLRDVFDNLLETSKNRQRNFPKLLPLFILLYHLAWPSSFSRAAVCLHVIIAHVKAVICHSKICPKYLGVKCELLELKIIKWLWFTIY